MQSFDTHFQVVEEGMESTSILAAIASPFSYLLVPVVGFAAIGALNSELKSGKWLAGAICLQLATGFTVGFLVYQVGTLITTGSLGAGFVGGMIAVIIFAAVIASLIAKSNKQFDSEYALNNA